MVRKILKGFGYLFAAMVVGMLALGIFGEREQQPARAPASWQERDDSAVALGRAQRALKEHLKAPASAKVPGFGESQGHVIALPDQRYLIESWIDSQNSFGAMIRTHYSAAVVQKDKDIWEVVEIQLK